MSYAIDIPRELARAAYSGVSFTPEKRAQQVQDGYNATLQADLADLQKLILNKPEMVATLAAEFERYRQGYRARYLKKLASDSRCVSWMIAGPSNFPVRQMEKRNNVAHKRLTELLEFRERALAAIRKTLCPELRPIMSGDSDAVERLKENIDEAEKLQARMKTANTILRQYLKKDDKAGKLKLIESGFTTAEAERIFTTKDCFGGYGYASFKLTNNNANIRRMKKRLETVEVNKILPSTTSSGDYARMEDCPADNRVRLFFPGKPSAEVRERLKSSGFRWTPTLGCWQAYRHEHTRQAALREVGAIAVEQLSSKSSSS
jgi:hypothetical protein